MAHSHSFLLCACCGHNSTVITLCPLKLDTLPNSQHSVPVSHERLLRCTLWNKRCLPSDLANKIKGVTVGNSSRGGCHNLSLHSCIGIQFYEHKQSLLKSFVTNLSFKSRLLQWADGRRDKKCSWKNPITWDASTTGTVCDFSLCRCMNWAAQ